MQGKITLAALLLVAWTAAPSAAGGVDQLTEEFSEELLALRPILATTVGDHRFDNRLAMEIGEPHRRSRRDLYRRYLGRLEQIDSTLLSPAELLTYRVFRRDLDVALAGLEFPDHLLPVSYSIDSLPNRLAALATENSVQPFATVADYDAFPQWVDLALANMELGIERGVVQPCPLVDRSLRELSALLVEDPLESVFYQPIGRLPPTIAAADRRRLAAAQAEVVGARVLPAYRRLHSYLSERYRLACRASAGLGALPDGERWYAWQIEHHTTTRQSPDDIFRVGQREIRRIRHEMELLIRQLGFGRDWNAFFAHLRSRQEEWIFDPGRVIAEYRGIGERLASRLPELFARRPATVVELRQVAPFLAPTAPRGFYARPSADGERPGTFYVNLAGRAYPRWSMEALYLHEVVPGHHFQISLAQERSELPRYRRLAPNSAYVEGWALYAESLGGELGLYRNPYQRWGRLASDMLRACRLVGDTAVHGKGWSRQRVRGYLDSRCFGIGVDEIDRWSAWPAQGLAYKLGQLKISELRR
ncbi:MAG: DUF885 family protein, partial [Thermoanaerobaculia bacterium]